MKFLNNVEIDGTLTVGGTNVKTQLTNLQTNINTANTNMNKIKTYVGSDGKLHFTNASGADTALNFNSKSQIDELWINPNPMSTFKGQTISINLSSYYGVIILAKAVYNYETIPANLGYGFGYVDGETVKYFVNGSLTRVRSFYVSSNGIRFNYGAFKGDGDTDTSGSGGSAIPIKIYGIK